MEENNIKILKRFFTISVAAFEMQHTVSIAFGYKGDKSYMHNLHITALEEINKENPNQKVMDNLLLMIENHANKNK